MLPWHKFVLLLTATFFAVSVVACEPKSEVDHYAIAKTLEGKLETPGNYGDSAYENIAQELQLVQSGDSTYEVAQSWLKEIQTKRRATLFKTGEAPEVQEGGSHPTKPAGGSLAKSSKPRGSLTAAGWLPYNDVPTNMANSSASSASSRGSKHQSAKSSCNKGPVTIYGTSWCGVCKEARSYFKKKGIAFSDKDVEKDASAMAEFKRKAPGAKSYPVIDIGGDIIPGFSTSAIERKMCI